MTAMYKIHLWQVRKRCIDYQETAHSLQNITVKFLIKVPNDNDG